MSLIFTASYPDAATGEPVQIIYYPFLTEKSRHTVWGAPIMETFGLKLLPSLRTGDIYASGDQLDALAWEAQTILNNAAAIAPHTQCAEDLLISRTTKLLDAIRQVQPLNGEVYIG